QITGLDVLVKIENAKAALSFLFERTGNAKTGHLHQIATLLKTIARHYVRVDHASLERLVRMSKAIRPEHTGLTEKDKECLRQFSDPNRLHALLTLPVRLVQAAEERKRPRRGDAVSIAIALAIAIELQIPIRSDNLTGLDCEKHLRPYGEMIHLTIA